MSARETASARLDGEVSELEAARLDAHLSGCAECRLFAAEIGSIAVGLRAAALELRNELAMTGHAAALLREVVAAKRKRVVLVGHEPELSSLVFELTGTSLIMQKAMIVAISCKADGRTELKFVIDPRRAS